MTEKRPLTKKTLEELEKISWPPPPPADEASHLVLTCHALRKRPLAEFTTEDLRIMIGQSIGLEHLIPLAIERLERDLLAQGDFYEGDLLQMVLTCDRRFWARERATWEVVVGLVSANLNVLQEVDTSWQIRKAWFDAYRHFLTIHEKA